MYEIIKDATDIGNIKQKTTFSIFDNNETAIIDNLDMSNYCNEYFVNIGMKMASKINSPKYNFKIKNNNASIFLTPVTEQEIIQQISSLKNDSAPGLDGISAKLIKLVHLEIISPLAHIINLIFETGNVPNNFKQSVVIPIHKSGSKKKLKILD